MNKEPEKENLWSILSSRKTQTKIVDFPAYDEKGNAVCKILIKTLTHDDHIKIQKDATADCDRSFSEEKEKIDRNSGLYLDRYENIAAKHFLFHCCYEPDEPTKRVFPTPIQVGKLSQDEVNILLQHYRTLQNEKGPLVAYLSSDQFDSWVEKLSDSGEDGAYFLDRILPEAKNQLLLFMASQLSAKTPSQTDKFSPTSPPDESTKNIKTDSQ